MEGLVVLKKMMLVIVGTVMILKGAGVAYTGLCVATENAVNSVTGSYGVTVDFTSQLDK